MDLVDNWTTQVRKGLVELSILNALRARERYGYELVKELTSLPGLEVTEGTLYPLLSRLRVQRLVGTRLVESAEGPARKYYALTARGEGAVEAMNAYFRELVRGLRLLMERGERVGRGDRAPSREDRSRDSSGGTERGGRP